MNKWHRQYRVRGQKQRLSSGGKIEAKSDGISYERTSGMCKTGALTAELTAPEQSYFNDKTQLCKIRAPDFYDLKSQREGYALCAFAEGKSRSTVEAVVSSVNYLGVFLTKYLQPTDVREITAQHIRAIILYKDIDKTCANIAKVSQKDADAFRQLYQTGLPALPYITAGSINPPAPFSNTLAGMLTSANGLDSLRMTFIHAIDLIDEMFETDLMKIAMTRIAAIARISPWEAGTAGLLPVMIPSTMQHGTRRVVGGSGKFVEAVEAAVKAFGGTVRVNAPVKQVTIENNIASGVVLASGEKISAGRCVIASINIKQLFPDMLPDARLPDGFVKWVKRLKPQRVQYFTTHYALHQSPAYRSEADVSRSSQVHFTGTTNHEEYLTTLQAMYRGIPRTNGCGILCSTLIDPTRAPAGKHTLWVNSQEPFYVKGGPKRWDEIKGQVTAEILKNIRAQTYNMGPDNFIGEKTYSPLDFSRWNPAWLEGDPSHIGGYIHQYSSYRPVPGWSGYKMPVEKLYMCGPSTHGGTGLAGGGRAPAAVILKDLGMDFEKVATAPV